MNDQQDPTYRWRPEDGLDRGRPSDPTARIGFNSAVREFFQSQSGPGAIVAALGGIALLAWGITWLTLGRWLGIVLVLLGLASLAAIGRVVWKLVRTRRRRSSAGRDGRSR